MVYKPTLIEIAISVAPVILALMIITVLSKLFPVLPIHELAEEENLAFDGIETDLVHADETDVFTEDKKVYNN